MSPLGNGHRPMAKAFICDLLKFTKHTFLLRLPRLFRKYRLVLKGKQSKVPFAKKPRSNVCNDNSKNCVNIADSFLNRTFALFARALRFEKKKL